MPIPISNAQDLVRIIQRFQLSGQLKEDSKICARGEEYDPFYTNKVYLINSISLEGENIILSVGNTAYDPLPPELIPSSFSIHWQWGGPGEWRGYLVSHWVNGKGENCAKEYEYLATMITIDYDGTFRAKCYLWPTQEIVNSRDLMECEKLLESWLIDRKNMKVLYEIVKKAEQSKTPLGEWWKTSQ